MSLHNRRRESFRRAQRAAVARAVAIDLYIQRRCGKLCSQVTEQPKEAKTTQ